MKTCKRCGISKSFDCFNKHKNMKDGYFSFCKDCYNKTTSKWRELNRHTHRKATANWTANNRSIKNLAQSIRRSNKLKRTPKWADLERIKAYYDVCSFFNEVNGYIKYHVDHIVPLQGTQVSGLHVHNNLRVILAEDNLTKGNKYNGI